MRNRPPPQERHKALLKIELSWGERAEGKMRDKENQSSQGKIRKHRIQNSATLVFSLLLSQAPFTSADILKQLHVITRHGSRPPLSKDANTLLESGGETLTPLGQKQLFDLGKWLRDQYAVGDFMEIYDHKMDRLESSNLDRTLTSANSLSLGVFPKEARLGGNADQFFQNPLPHPPAIPIFSRQDKNDIYLRAYHNCPRFNQNLKRLYTSGTWISLEENSQTLLQKLAEKLPTLLDDNITSVVALKDVWNFYDLIHVARTECNPDPTSYACQSAIEDPNIRSALSDDEFAELESVVHQTEQLKFGLATAESLLGSNLLWEILDRTTQSGRFFLYSAHAPTILGLLSTLKTWGIGELFVDYGSAIVVEVYESSSQAVSIRIVYKAASNATSTPVTLSDIDCNGNNLFVGQDTSTCPIENVISWAEKNTLKTVENWCKVCENISSDVCLMSAAGPWALLEEETQATEPEVILGTFFGGFAAGLVFMFLCVTFANAFRGNDQRETIVPCNVGHDGQPPQEEPNTIQLDEADHGSDEKSLASIT
ncbi:unnamed protein product [Cylindrotheca closterium]|uniref:2,3-bisphosphoglycerate 3-phosphatase n=1 Tax=Cylindrotheca closterium TaxID=2856 RepID=A0AAD2JH35_9STRA|nr:unnamed protein product [Cylindrotheca closterium]